MERVGERVEEMAPIGLGICICGHSKSYHDETGCKARIQVFTDKNRMIYDKPCRCEKYVEDTIDTETDPTGDLGIPVGIPLLEEIINDIF
jgi:hypothetical protein